MLKFLKKGGTSSGKTVLVVCLRTAGIDFRGKTSYNLY